MIEGSKKVKLEKEIKIFELLQIAEVSEMNKIEFWIKNCFLD